MAAGIGAVRKLLFFVCLFFFFVFFFVFFLNIHCMVMLQKICKEFITKCRCTEERNRKI